MQKLLLSIAAAAALAFAAPQAAMAQHHGGGGGSHASGGGGGGGGGRSFSGHSGASRSFSGGISNRSFNSGGSFHGHAHQSRMNRNFAAANDRVMSSNRSVNRADRRVTNQRIASNDRGRHRHHRHHRHFSGVWWGPGYYYDDYAAYDGCYQWVWTNFGYRYVDTCGTDYYGVY